MGESTDNPLNDRQRTATEPSISFLILEAVTAREEINPGDCPPLYDVIDPDALDNLFATTQAGNERHGKVTFQYCGYHITVSGDRTISLDPVTADDS
ncbi:HalOD1 output domain-containing protein [Haladaptatus sp. W1]|uniref:HalOD1 output domain-containing protein n=1 Tax=Haladaptatus sp. W1 TaxID=1897478 RepID=UPI0009F3DAB6|nr:HalOD1 output domain-containing protein [Haladaptatus sp. W1]